MAGLLAVATCHEVMVHQMAGFDAQAARQACAVPQGYTPVAVSAAGFLADASRLPPSVEEKDPDARERKSCDEFVFAEQWPAGGS